MLTVQQQQQDVSTTSQIKSLVEHHLLQLEGISDPEQVSTLYTIIRDVDAPFNQLRISRPIVVELKKKWLVLPIGEGIYLLDCFHWLFITGDNDPFLTIDLKDLLCVHHHHQNRHHNRDSTTMNPKFDSSKIPPAATTLSSETTYYPFSITAFTTYISQLNCSREHHVYVRQLQLWCDYSLANSMFSGTEKDRLLKKMLKKYDSYCSDSDNESVYDAAMARWCVSFGLMYNLLESHIIHNQHDPSKATLMMDTNLVYECVQDINFPMLKECIEWELFLYRHSNGCSKSEELLLDEMTNLMDTHFKWYSLHSTDYAIPRPLWFDYNLFDDHSRIMWLVEDLDGKPVYWVRFEWLACLFTGVEEQEHPHKLVQGRVSLSEKEFISLFLPNLYKQILLDTMHLFYMLRTKNKDAPLIGLGSPFYTHFASRNYPFYQQLRENGDDYYNYSLSYGLQHSPVIKQLVKREEITESLSSNNNNNNTGNRVVVSKPPFNQVATLVPDIEDLVTKKYLPPCLKNLVSVKHLNNDDRRTVIPYFIDMGYREAPTVRVLSLDAKKDAGALEQQFQYQIRKNNAPLTNGAIKYDNCSLFCSTLINLGPKAGNHTIQCPYEAEKRKGGPSAPRHGNYSDSERRAMTSKCANSLKSDKRSPQFVSHPIDYVHYSIINNKNTSNQ